MSLTEAMNDHAAREVAQATKDALEAAGWAEFYDARRDIYLLINRVGGSLKVSAALLTMMDDHELRALADALREAADLPGPLWAEATREGDSLPTVRIIQAEQEE